MKQRERFAVGRIKRWEESSRGDIALVSSNWNGLEGACDDRAVTWDKSLPAPARIADSFQATRLVEEKKANNHSSITCLPMT